MSPLTDVPLIFEATLHETSCIKIDGDGGGRVTFTITDKYREAVKSLIDMRKQPLVLTVELGELKG